MTRRPFLAVAALLAGFAFQLGAEAQITEVAGVKFEPGITLAGSALQLNGAGIRYKAIFKVYAAGLYVPTKVNTPEAVINATGPRRMQIVMLRDIDAEELGKLFTRGMEQNAPREDFAKSLPGIMRMSDIFFAKKKLIAGDGFTVDWLPGTGALISVNGKPAGEPVKEPEFYASLMAIWFGKQPADAALKDALLGRAAVKADPMSR